MNTTIPRLTAAVLVLCASALPAAGQTVQPPAGAAPGIQPITTPVKLATRPVRGCRFAAEAINAGTPMPNNPQRMAIEGNCDMDMGKQITSWILSVNRLTLDRTVVSAAGPLGNLSVNMDNNAPLLRNHRIDVAGLNASAFATNANAQRTLRRFLDTMAFAVYAPPQAPVGERSPLLEINAALIRHLNGVLRDVQLVQAAPPAFVVGAVAYQNRQSLLVRQSGPFVARAYGQDMALTSQTDGVVDIDTGMPLFLGARVTGDIRMPFASGPVDFTLRLAIALDGMPDPQQTLAAAAAPPPTPMPAAAAPPPRPVPAPAAAPAAAPAPRPAPPPAGATAAQQQRLQSLKGLYDQGLISREQFELRQREILSGQ